MRNNQNNQLNVSKSGSISAPQLPDADALVVANSNNAISQIEHQVAQVLRESPEERAARLKESQLAENARILEVTTTYFDAINIEQVAEVLSNAITKTPVSENLRDVLWASNLQKLANAALQIFNVADRAWKKDLPQYWDANHRVAMIKDPIIETENSISNTILTRFLREANRVVFKDDSFLRESNHPLFNPCEVQKGVFKENPPGPYYIPASFFNMFKFLRKKQTAHVELDNLFTDMVAGLMNYAQENLRGREKVHSADFMFIYIVLQKLDALLQAVEQNKSKSDILEIAGQLIVYVELIRRCQFFDNISWVWSRDTKKETQYRQGMLQETGRLTMNQVIKDLCVHLRRLHYELIKIINNRSIHANAARLSANGSSIALTRKQVICHVAGTELFADPDEMRLFIRGRDIKNKSKLVSKMDEEEVSLLTAVAVHERPESRLMDSRVASRQNSNLAGVKDFSRQIQDWIVKYNPGHFNDSKQFESFVADLIAIFETLLPKMKIKELKGFLDDQARDYASLITSMAKTEIILKHFGDLIQKLSRNSGELVLCLFFMNEMQHACKAILDIASMAFRILDNMMKRKDTLLGYDLKGYELSRDQNFLALFTGSGLSLIARIEEDFREIKENASTFLDNLQKFNAERFKDIIREQVQASQELKNLGWCLRENLLMLAGINRYEASELTFPLAKHETQIQFDASDPFIRKQAQLLGIAMAQTAQLANESVEDAQAKRIASLEAEVAKLTHQIVAFHQPILDRGYHQAMVELYLKTNPQEAAMHKRAAEGNDRVARLLVELKVLNFAFQRAYRKMSDSKSAMLSPEQFIAELKEECLKIQYDLFSKEVQVVYQDLMEQRDLEREKRVEVEAISSSAVYLVHANKIYALVNRGTKTQNFREMDLIESKIALEEEDIDELLGSAARLPVSSLDLGNLDETPKSLPTEENLAVVANLFKAKEFFKMAANRIAFSYTQLWIPSAAKTGFFGKSQTPSPDKNREIFKIQNCAENGPLSFEMLYAAFLLEFKKMEFTQESLNEAVRRVVIGKIFSKLFIDYAASNFDNFLGCICAGALIELSAFAANEPPKEFTLKAKSLEAMREEYGNDVGAFVQGPKYNWVQMAVVDLQSQWQMVGPK